MLRGLAAAAVLCGHLRLFTFVNFGVLIEPNLVTKAFYAATGMGHQAVIVFFALSGFLVGGKALADMSADRWSWAHYLLRRLTRLLIVIVPALFATAVLDHLGIRWTGGAGYDGAFYDVYSSGPNTARPLIYSPITLLGRRSCQHSVQLINRLQEPQRRFHTRFT